MRHRVNALGAILSLAVAACSDFIEPKTLASAWVDQSDWIPYRPLAQSDFKSPTATGRDEFEVEHADAETCAQIVSRPSEVTTRETKSSTGGSVYTSSLDEPIFFAAFNRGCSWWKPKHRRTSEDILEHEQTHFGIQEIEARRLNTQLTEIVQRIRTTGTNSHAVFARADAEFGKVLEAAAEAAHARHRQFDEDSFKGGRDLQHRWYLRVTAELDALRSFARGPQLALLEAHSDTTPATATPLPATTSSPPRAPQPMSTKPAPRAPQHAPERPVAEPPPNAIPPVPTKSFPAD